MIKEYKGYKVGDLIQIKSYEECALWWYTDLYLGFGKECPTWKSNDKKSIIWKIEAIIEPLIISRYETRYLMFLTSGERYLGIDVDHRPESFCKINSYTLKYEKK